MILLDTCVVSEWMKPEGKMDATTIAKIEDYPSENVYISVITVYEIWNGIIPLAEGKRKQKLSDTADNILAKFNERCLSIDFATADIAAHIMGGRKKYNDSICDIMIAATALRHNFCVCTYNVRDFKGLTAYKKTLPTFNPRQTPKSNPLISKQ